MRKSKKRFFLFFLLTLQFLISCKSSSDGGTTVGNPQVATVQVELNSYSVASTNPLNSLIAPVYAGINNLTFCFKRLRFKLDDANTQDPENSEDNIDFNLGEVVLSPSGTVLATIDVPVKKYKRLEFDLENDCSSGYSVDLLNDNGHFVSTKRITIKFSGSYTPSDGEALKLSIDHISNAFKDYNGTGSDLRDTLEALSGSL